MSWGRLEKSAAVAWHPQAHLFGQQNTSRDAFVHTPEGSSTDISTTDQGDDSPGIHPPLGDGEAALNALKPQSNGHFQSNAKNSSGVLELPTLALGSMGLDPKLEIAVADFSNASGNFSVAGSAAAPAPFQCIDWTINPHNPYGGMIAGGMSDGSVTLWDPSKVVKTLNDSSETNHSANGLVAVTSIDRHHRVQALQFSPLKKYLLAAGTSHGLVSIIDTEYLDNVAVYEPGTDPTESQGSETTCIAWNESVAHILAAGSSCGKSVVWDLKQRKPVISISDPSHRHSRPSSILWLPHQPTQLLVVYDDDSHPGPQLWDLRNAAYPLKEATPSPPFGHTRGIVNAALNPMDPHLLLTTGRDHRVVCWWLGDSDSTHQTPQQSNASNTSGDMFEVYVQQQIGQPLVQAKWCPSVPGMYAAASPMSIFIQSIHGAAENESILLGPAHNARIPSWFKHRRSVDCGISGDIASFTADSKTVSTIRLPRECSSAASDFHMQEVMVFDHHIASNTLKEMCNEQMQQETDAKDEWKAVHKRFQANNAGNTRESASPELIAKVEAFLGEPIPFKSQTSDVNQLQNTAQAAPPAYTPPAVPADPEKFFSELGGESTAAEAEKRSDEQNIRASSNSFEGSHHESRMNSSLEGNIEWSAESASLVRECILRGYFEGAICLLMKLGLDGDALLIAAGLEQNSAYHPNEQSLWRYTARAYVEKIKDKFLNMVGYALLGEFSNVVSLTESNDWKECLQLLSAFVKSEEHLANLSSELGQRMLKEYNDSSAALMCMIMARDFQGACSLWQRQLQVTLQRRSERHMLQDSGSFILATMKKMVALKSAIGYAGGCTAFECVCCAYAYHLESIGCPAQAMRILYSYLGVNDYSGGVGPYHASSLELANRIYHAHTECMQQCGFVKPPALTAQMIESQVPKVTGAADQGSQYARNSTNPYSNKPQGATPAWSPQPNMQKPYSGNVNAPNMTQNMPPNMTQNMPPNMTQNMPPNMTQNMPPMGMPPSNKGNMPPMGMPPSNIANNNSNSMNNTNNNMPPMNNNRPLAGNTGNMPPLARGNTGNVAPGNLVGNVPPNSVSPMKLPSHESLNNIMPGGSTTRVSSSPVQGFKPGVPPVYGQAPNMNMNANKMAAHSQPDYGHPFGGSSGQNAQYNNGVVSPPSAQPQAITAPTVGAQPLKPGMPVPWPIPTSSQLNQRATRSTYAANVGINRAAEKSGDGFVLPPEQLTMIRNVLTNLAQQSQAPGDTLQKLEDMFSMCTSGELSASACQKLVTMCEHLQRNDIVAAQKIHAELSASEWGTRNKFWLMALKRLVSRS